MKILAIILILGGVGGILDGEFLFGLLLLVGGVFLFKNKTKTENNKKSLKENSNIDTKSAIKVETINNNNNNNTKSNKNTYTFRIVGITYEGREKNIKEIVNDWKECNPEDLYFGMKNKEIADEYENIYEVDVYDWCDIKLIPEPDNKHDPNAIKVVSDFGMLGYVPADETKKVKGIIEKEHDLQWKIIGGKYKYYDDAEDKVRTKTLTYGVEIYLNY